MPNKILHISLVFFVFFLLGMANFASAQRVALVFSGGGARGLVHIGAIFALEENNIPIDAIAGTSIGAIVGGLYAAGYTPNEMVEFFASNDFKRWSTGDYLAEGHYSYKSQPPTAAFFTLHLNLSRRTGLSLAPPTNYVPPYQMDFAFMQLFAGATAAANSCFDSLMVPFRAVSYDAYNKRAYCPAQGDMGAVVRASMTFPGFFKPVVIDSLLLFDGGLTNNFPVTVAERDLQADFIIGLKCADNYDRPTEDDVFSHITSLTSRPTEYSIDTSCGVLISIDSLNVALMDFDRLMELIDVGYEATQRAMPQIKRHISRRETYDEISAKRDAFRRKIPPLMFGDICVSGSLNPRRQRNVERAMRRDDEPAQPLEAMRRRYFNLVSDGGVTTFFPTAKFSETDSAFALHLRASAAPNVALSVGGCFSNFSNLGFLGLELRSYSRVMARLGANVYFGNVYNSVKAYGRLDYRFPRSEFPLFIEAMFIRNKFDYYSSNPDLLFSDTKPDFIQTIESFSNFSLGLPFIANSVLRLGMKAGQFEAKYYAERNFSSTDIPEQLLFNFSEGYATAERSTLNHKLFATKGASTRANLSYATGTEWHVSGMVGGVMPQGVDSSEVGVVRHRRGARSLWALRVTHEHYLKPFRHLSLGYYLEGAFAQPILFSDYYSTLLMLPAFDPMPNTQGFFLENFRSSAYVAVGLMPSVPIWKDYAILRFEGYAFQPFRTLSKENVVNQIRLNDLRYDRSLRTFKLMGAVSLIFNTPFGSLSGSVSYYEKPNSRFYFSVMFGYNIYNRRAFY
jgi:NTE family protein